MDNHVIVRFQLTADERVMVGIKWLEYLHYLVVDRIDEDLFSQLAVVYELDVPAEDEVKVAKDVMLGGEAIRFYKTSMFTGGATLEGRGGQLQ